MVFVVLVLKREGNWNITSLLHSLIAKIILRDICVLHGNGIEHREGSWGADKLPIEAIDICLFALIHSFLLKANFQLHHIFEVIIKFFDLKLLHKVYRVYLFEIF